MVLVGWNGIYFTHGIFLALALVRYQWVRNDVLLWMPLVASDLTLRLRSGHAKTKPSANPGSESPVASEVGNHDGMACEMRGLAVLCYPVAFVAMAWGLSLVASALLVLLGGRANSRRW